VYKYKGEIKMNDYKPYCYMIGWTAHNIWYYGVEIGQLTKKAHPSNLWTSYFTSSKEVEQFRLLNGEPDFISIRKIFNDPKSALLWEHKFLSRIDAANSKNFLNKSNGYNHHLEWNLTHSDETKIKISDTKKGKRWVTNGIQDLYIEPQSIPDGYQLGRTNGVFGSGNKNIMYGKTHTEEARQKISSTHKGKIISKEQREKISKANTGLKRSKEFINKMKKIEKTDEWNKKNSEARKNTKLYINTETLVRKYFKASDVIPQGWIWIKDYQSE